MYVLILTSSVTNCEVTTLHSPGMQQWSIHTCNPWVSGGAEASVDGAAGVGEAAAGREGGGRPP